MTAPKADTQIAEFLAVGPGRMTVELSADGLEFTFRITGRTNSLSISDDEAAELAGLLQRNRRQS